MNRQGPDIGTQYRSGIYTTSKDQDAVARKVVKELNEAGAFDGRPIVTQIEGAEEFYVAEPYHQDYVDRTGRACHPGIGPAIEEFTALVTKKNASS